MKKIIFVNDSYHFSEGGFEFIRKLHEKEPLLVTGIFLPQSMFAGVLSYAATANGLGTTGYFPAVEEDEALHIENEMKRFEEKCVHHGIPFRIHKEVLNLTIPMLRIESRFADLMILSGELFYKPEEPGGVRLEYLRDTIRASECPVLIVPEQYQFPENLILSYDGSEESVYAIKQFAYLFPELTKKPALLVYAADEDESTFPEGDYMKELATQHFTDLTFHKLDMDPGRYFSKWIEGKKGGILICGSMGRSAISGFLKKSFAAGIIREHKLPVFVAHRS